MVDWVILGLEQDIQEMSLEHLLVPECITKCLERGQGHNAGDMTEAGTM